MIKLQNNLELNFIFGGMFNFPSGSTIKKTMISRPAIEYSDTPVERDNHGIKAPASSLAPTPVTILDFFE